MKHVLFYALAASSLMFSACSSDDPSVAGTGNNQNDVAQQIVLQVASSGDGLITRAGRPLYSSAAGQTIQNVRVLIYNTEEGDESKKIVYDGSLDWTKSKEYTTNGHGREFTITLKGEDKLAKGSYKVVAVGYSTGSEYTYAPDVTGTAASLKGTTYSDITATLAADKNAEEVFAGDAALTIDDKQQISNKSDGETGLAVTLHRQVAGSFGYFKNIPAEVNGVKATTLRLVMRDENNVLTFNQFNSAFTTTNNNLKYVVNGSKTQENAPAANAKFLGSTDNDGYVLYSIDLTKWFPNGDANKDGYYNYEDAKLADANWVHDTSVKTKLEKGSVFASNYIIPFALATGKKTMELQLLDADGNILKTWNVSIPANDVNNDTNNGSTDESASIFNVVRNHMYNFGIKLTQEPVTPDKPTPTPDPDPDPDPSNPDQPEDLSKGQNLILKVNDNWEAIHQMELE